MVTDEAQQIPAQTRRSGWAQHPAVRRLIMMAIAVAAVAGLVGVVQPAMTPAVAQAYTIQGPERVGFGRAVVLFNREETRLIGMNKFKLPPNNPVSIAFNVTSATLAAIAKNYYNRGLCSAYAWSVRPWDNQGFMSRKC